MYNFYIDFEIVIQEIKLKLDFGCIAKNEINALQELKLWIISEFEVDQLEILNIEKEKYNELFAA